MRKTIRNVMMVVLVLMTNCQVSLNPKSGPVTSQIPIRPTATMKTRGRAQKCAAHFAKREYQEEFRISKEGPGTSAKQPKNGTCQVPRASNLPVKQEAKKPGFTRATLHFSWGRLAEGFL